MKLRDKIKRNGSMSKPITGTVLLVACSLLISACSGQPLSTREKGAIYGTAGGAATGAVIGAITGNPGAGAAIGAGLGLVGGALVGNSMQNRQTEQAQVQQ